MEKRRFWKPVAVVFALGIIGLGVVGGGTFAKATNQGVDATSVYANTVMGHEGAPYAGRVVCAETNRFPQGQQVVWRIRVLDEAGNPMDDTRLKSVVVKLPDGQQFTAEFGGHPGGPGVTPTDYYWTADWDIPLTYPTGSIGYQVVATGLYGDRVATFSDFNVKPSLLAVIPAA